MKHPAPAHGRSCAPATRTSARWLALVALAALAGACARPAAPPDEIVFWQRGPEGALAPIVARFEAGHPGLRVRVERVAAGGDSARLAAALASGEPPDLCQIASARMPELLASGRLCDWSAGVADLRDSLVGWPLCTEGDAIYGLPWLLDPEILHVDRDLMRRAGLDPAHAPETWPELAADAARIQRLGHGVHGFGVADGDAPGWAPALLPLFWSNGGELFSDKLDSSRVDSPENLEALEFALKLRRTGLVAPPDSLAREFERGRLGFVIAPASGAAGARAHGAVALVPRPAAGRGEHASLATGEVLVSFTSSRRKESALRLARFLSRPENALPAALAQGLVPATPGADTSALLRGRPREQLVLRQLAHARFEPARPAWSAVQDSLEAALGGALAGRRNAREALADADQRLAALLRRP